MKYLFRRCCFVFPLPHQFCSLPSWAPFDQISNRSSYCVCGRLRSRTLFLLLKTKRDTIINDNKKQTLFHVALCFGAGTGNFVVYNYFLLASHSTLHIVQLVSGADTKLLSFTLDSSFAFFSFARKHNSNTQTHTHIRRWNKNKLLVCNAHHNFDGFLKLKTIQMNIKTFMNPFWMATNRVEWMIAFDQNDRIVCGMVIGIHVLPKNA